MIYNILGGMRNMQKSVKFNQFSEIWLQRATLGVTYTHRKNLESYVTHLNSFIGDKELAEIKPFDMDVIICKLYECNPNTNKPASKKFLSNIIGCATRIFDFAIENEIIYKNPAKGKKKTIPKNAPVKIVSPITSEQQQLVIDVDHRGKIAAVIMMFMGLRTGELLALEWNDVDLDKLQVSVNKRLQKVDGNKYILSEGTKNGENRFVSIPENLGAWLSKQKSIAKSYLVCPNRSGELNTPTQWKRLWESYQNAINYYCYTQKCKSLDIKPEKIFSPNKIPRVVSSFNPHQLRHTYATMLYISGVDTLTARELLGHSNIETTLKIYTHLDKKFKQLNITKFDNYIKSDLDIDNI